MQKVRGSPRPGFGSLSRGVVQPSPLCPCSSPPLGMVSPSAYPVIKTLPVPGARPQEPSTLTSPPTLPLSSQRKQPLLPLPLQCHLLPHVSVTWVTWEHGGSLGAVPLFPPPKQRFSQLRQQTFSEQLLCLVPWMCGHQWMRTWGKDRQMDPCSDGMGRDTSQCGLQRLLTHPLPRAFLTP